MTSLVNHYFPLMILFSLMVQKKKIRLTLHTAGTVLIPAKPESSTNKPFITFVNWNIIGSNIKNPTMNNKKF